MIRRRHASNRITREGLKMVGIYVPESDAKPKRNSICADCGSELSEDEIAYPNWNPDGKRICDSCRRDYEFTCCVCQDWKPDKEQGAIGNLLAVVDATEMELPTGLYVVKEHPYFVDSILDVRLYEDALRRIGDVSSAINTNGHAAGHVCRECSTKLKKELRAARKTKL